MNAVDLETKLALIAKAANEANIVAELSDDFDKFDNYHDDPGTTGD